MKVKFIIEYNDDFNKHHITFATSMAEVKYIEARFFKIKITPCSQMQGGFPPSYVPITQQVEQWTFNPYAEGSTPSGHTLLEYPSGDGAVLIKRLP